MKKGHSNPLDQQNKAKEVAEIHGMIHLMHHAEQELRRVGYHDGVERTAGVTDFSHRGAIHA